MIQYDGSGIRSLKRANDVYDTDYIAANGALGRLLIRYRTTHNGDWRELRDLLITAPQAGGRTIGYSLGVRPPTLAARSTAGAAVGAAGLRALDDGLVPSVSPPGGRGAGGGRGGGPGAPGDPRSRTLETGGASRPPSGDRQPPSSGAASESRQRMMVRRRRL